MILCLVFNGNSLPYRTYERLVAGGKERVGSVRRKRATVSQAGGEQAQAERAQAEVTAVRAMNTRAKGVSTSKNAQTHHPRIGQRRPNQQPRQTNRIAEMASVDAKAAALLIREVGFDEGATAIQP